MPNLVKDITLQIQEAQCKINLSTKQKQREDRLVVTKGWGKGWIGSLGLADTNSYIEWINNKVLTV